ncbi:MAG: hypothetical protein AB3N28_05880 [Kordiimonas sp.]
MMNFQPLNLLRRALGVEWPLAQEGSVAVGDKYAQTDDELSVWTVERISEVQMSRFPLVSLSRENHPHLVKTVSLAALADGEDFRPAM